MGYKKKLIVLTWHGESSKQNRTRTGMLTNWVLG